MSRSARIALLSATQGLAAILSMACGPSTPPPYTGPTKVDIPVENTTRSTGTKAPSPVRESPPGSSNAKGSKFPAMERAELPNGLGISVVNAQSLPIVQVRLVVRAGAGYGASPAVATLAGDILKDGGTRSMTSAEVLGRIESLGADISISTDSDATVLSLSSPKDKLAQAFAVFAEVVQSPRFDEGELRKLKARTVDDAREAAKGRGSFSATRALFRELYAGRGPYAVRGLVPSEIEKVTSGDLRAFHAKFYVPSNAHLVFAGDIDLASAKDLSTRAFQGWKRGAAPQLPETVAPALPKERRVFVCDRPKAAQSDVYVATLAPERSAASWPTVRVATQVLGGGVAGRLFADVREKRSLAYSTGAQVYELAMGAQPMVAYAGTQAPKTDAAVQGLLDNLQSMHQGNVTSTENETARRFLSDVFAIRMETVGAVADLTGRLRVLGLPDTYWDDYRAQLRSTEVAQTNELSKAGIFDVSRALIVVAGDAETIAEPLRKFGEVTVLDPEKELQVKKTLPKAAESQP